MFDALLSSLAFLCDTLLYVLMLPVNPPNLILYLFGNLHDVTTSVCRATFQHKFSFFLSSFVFFFFPHTVLQGFWAQLKRGYINNPWILSPCVNAVPTCKCKSLVGHSFDTFKFFLLSLPLPHSLALSLSLWQSNFD